MMDKPADTAAPIHTLLAKRWSPRAFDPHRPVAPQQVTALMEAARWAPSCFGDEPWRMVICDRFEDNAAWHAALLCLTEKNQQWAQHAPLLILVAAATHFQNDKPNRWGQYDTGAASENLCLQAAAMGLAAHQMGGFDAQRVGGALGIPEGFTAMAFIAVGYAGAMGNLDEDQRQKETGPRRRAPLGTRFFRGRWGVPAACGTEASPPDDRRSGESVPSQPPGGATSQRSAPAKVERDKTAPQQP